MGVQAYLEHPTLLEELEKGSIKYASEEIGKAIVLAYKDVVVKQVKPEEIIAMVKEIVAARLAETLEFNIKKDAPKA